MSPAVEWVLLFYRLPRVPSTPRSAVWRKLKRLGAAQQGDLAARRRVLVRLRRDLRRIQGRDFFSTPQRDAARAAVEDLAAASRQAEVRA